jgi:putative ABC transport system permease protein
VARYPLARGAYRLLVRAYPREFRERFQRDLERDFVELLHRVGVVGAWRRVISDVFRAVPITTSDAMAERARSARIAGPILPPGEPLMRSVLFDLRHAVRALRKAPGFTIVTIATLALAIGANSAMFSLVNAVLLRPLGYDDPERLVQIHEAIPESGVDRFEVSPADYVDLETYQRSFSSLAAYRTRLFELSGRGEPEQIPVAEVTTSLFETLGVAAADGRVFSGTVDAADPAVAVISDRLWKRRYSAVPVIGEPVQLDRRLYTIVGVMPPSFEFPKRGAVANAEPADVWVPLVFNPFERQARGMMYNHSVVARLRDGVSVAQAAADTSALARRIQDHYPANLQNAFTLTIRVRPIIDELSGRVRRPLLILLAAVTLVLLVACANVASLILSRSVRRQREIGVRAALGAGRLRLFQILLLEGLLLAAAGGALGLALGYWTVRGIPSVIATSLPGVSDVSLDWRVVLFTAGASLGCAVVFALVPLLAGFRRNLHDLLREAASRATPSQTEQRVQSMMVAASVALAFVLLVSAGLMIRSFARLVNVDAGVAAATVLTAQVRLPYAAYRDAARIRTFYRLLEERLRAIPGVRAASLASDLPLDGDGERRVFRPEESRFRGLPPAVAVTWAHGDFPATFSIPVTRGRWLSTDEQNGDRRVAVVSQRLADTYWPGQDPIGKRFKWGLPDSPEPWKTIIGVTGDIADGPAGSGPSVHIYVPYSEISDGQLAAPTSGLLRRFSIAVNGDAEARAFAGSVRAAVAAIDPALAIARVQSFEQLRNDRLAPQRFSAWLLAGFAGAVLLMAAVGLYGTLAFAVSQRTREIGVRLALGADQRHVLRHIVWRGLMPAASGLLAGAAGAFAASRLLVALLFETGAHDPIVFSTVPTLLAVVAIVASYFPGRRAAAVDPIVAMRVE